MFSATIDTSKSPSGAIACRPERAGLVRAATALPQSVRRHADAPKPDLYLDDVVVTVPDGHNLIGNPNFEAGFTDGWSVSAGSATLTISTTVFHGGAQEPAPERRGRSRRRTEVPRCRPAAARYNVSFWVQHAGTVARTLTLRAHLHLRRRCGRSTLPAIATATDVAPNTWTQLTGTGAFPPANAAAGCKLLLAAVYVQHDGTACGTGAGIECPDLFIDDVSDPTLGALSRRASRQLARPPRPCPGASAA